MTTPTIDEKWTAEDPRRPGVLEHIICAAVYVDTQRKEQHVSSYAYPKTGLVFGGWRHSDCFVAMMAWADLLSPEEKARIGEVKLAGRDQGFITSRGRFVDRKCAAVLAFEAGQTETLLKSLTSEDIY